MVVGWPRAPGAVLAEKGQLLICTSHCRPATQAGAVGALDLLTDSQNWDLPSDVLMFKC